MLEVRQALGRGVDYFARYVASEAADLGASLHDADPPVVAHVRKVLEELDARGVPEADEVARALGRFLSETSSDACGGGWASPSSTADVRELLSRQRADGSWAAEADPTLNGTFISTATCLRALAASMPSIFDDSETDRSFWRDGCVILDFLDSLEIDTLAKAHLRIEGTSVEGFYSTWFRSLEVRAETDRSVRAVVASKLKTLFPEYRMVFGTFMSKGCEGETAFPMHQDPSLIDERQWTPLTFWIPLVDVEDLNGCMYAVPGSHLLSAAPRPSFAQFAYPDQEDELRRRHMRAVPMRAGQLLVFHSGLIHTSPANRSESLRLAAAGVMIPEAAQLQFVRVNQSSGRIEIFAVEDSFYLRMRAEDSLDDLPKLGDFAPISEPLDLARLPGMRGAERETATNAAPAHAENPVLGH